MHACMLQLQLWPTGICIARLWAAAWSMHHVERNACTILTSLSSHLFGGLGLLSTGDEWRLSLPVQYDIAITRYSSSYHLSCPASTWSGSNTTYKTWTLDHLRTGMDFYFWSKVGHTGGGGPLSTWLLFYLLAWPLFSTLLGSCKKVNMYPSRYLHIVVMKKIRSSCFLHQHVSLANGLCTSRKLKVVKYSWIFFKDKFL